MSLQQIANNYGEAYYVGGQSNVLEDPMHQVLQVVTPTRTSHKVSPVSAVFCPAGEIGQAERS